ncbi:MAG: N-6 DNA methylase [Alistipes sp.]|nr:N-6 DNA methylase [Alistipes sp.]
MRYNYNITVGEQLTQGKFDYPISDDLHYILIGDTTVAQLKAAGIIPRKQYAGLMKNKPDGLLVRGKNDVKVLVEYKQPGVFFNLEGAKNIITSWYYSLAKELNCRIICATDGDKSFWFSAVSKTEIRRSDDELYDFVLDISKISEIEKGYGAELALALDELETVDDFGKMREKVIHNPQNLAKKVWQKIWITTGKEPEPCLYNVVEIFVFKYLSDLSVLNEDYSFGKIYEKAKIDAEDALRYYADNVRSRIKGLFPAGEDGTTIINGTIFVNENGKANIAQAGLFKEVLKEFYEYGEEHGTFVHIDKNFKTRLYENFLRKTAGISSMGQYFTPRNVVRAIVSMAKAHPVTENSAICDPFCGVGGFLLEFLNENPQIKRQFEPQDGTIQPSIRMRGYDKGTDEKDDQRTIILAKANMLIYLSDIISKHTQYTKEFSEKVFNRVFHLIKSNVGTFGIDNEQDKYDLILTNPPYVTSGVSIIKNELKDRGIKNKIYKIPCTGLEGLSLEWIIYSLKPGGTAFVIVPDGLMKRSSDEHLRKYVLEKCILNAVISLPTRTFFATPQDTYILSVTKKEPQVHYGDDYNVFTYLVSEIGETRDSNRIPILQDDLKEASKFYRQFLVGKDDFKSTDYRCKIKKLSEFKENKWTIINDWSDEEKKVLNINVEEHSISEEGFIDALSDLQKTISSTLVDMKKIEIDDIRYKRVALADIGDFFRGRSGYDKRYCEDHKGEYPVFSADTKGDRCIGYINTWDYEEECITITTNGHYAGTPNYVPLKRFSLNSDCGVFLLKEEYRNVISYQYLEYALRNKRAENGYNWQNKPNKSEILELEIQIPVTVKGQFDIDAQQRIIKKYECYQKIKARIEREAKSLYATNVNLSNEERE